MTRFQEGCDIPGVQPYHRIESVSSNKKGLCPPGKGSSMGKRAGRARTKTAAWEMGRPCDWLRKTTQNYEGNSRAMRARAAAYFENRSPFGMQPKNKVILVSC